jgi:hypothetical protein
MGIAFLVLLIVGLLWWWTRGRDRGQGRPPLLQGLDAVDWPGLHHAYGPATDVPDLLRALADPDRASEELRAAAAENSTTIFEHVEWTLWGNIFHQGTVWQASAHTVPFLVEILLHGRDDAELRTFLLRYLHHLATGYPEDRFPARADPETWFAAAADVERRARHFDPDNLDERWDVVWARDCYRAVEHQLPGLLGFLDHGATAVANQAVALVSSFPRQSALTAPRLRRLMERGGPPAGPAAVALALVVGPPAHAEVRPLIDSPDPGVALHAACAAVIADSAVVDDATVTLLATPLDEPLADEESALASTLRNLVGSCLSLLVGRHHDRAVRALAGQLRDAGHLTSVSLTGALLGMIFPGGSAPARSQDLDAGQRLALEAIRDHGAFEVLGAIFANYSQCLREFGLPGDRDGLARWLAA